MRWAGCRLTARTETTRPPRRTGWMTARESSLATAPPNAWWETAVVREATAAWTVAIDPMMGRGSPRGRRVLTSCWPLGSARTTAWPMASATAWAWSLKVEMSGASRAGEVERARRAAERLAISRSRASAPRRAAASAASSERVRSTVAMWRRRTVQNATPGRRRAKTTPTRMSRTGQRRGGGHGRGLV